MRHSQHLKRRYDRSRFVVEQEEWPPNQPKHFTNLALIDCKDIHANRKFTSTHSSLDNMFSTSSQEDDKISKDIEEIFTCDKDGKEPRSILIEGAPGIGKTVLSKEIAFRWATGGLLVNKILLYLIFLRDPLVQKITSLEDLVKYYYRFDESSSTISSSCADYLLDSCGEHVTFIFDGYDEYPSPKNLQQNDFVLDILHRNLLPCCQIVVTSRLHASAHLRVNCDRFIQILGFTKEERHNYILNSLNGKRGDIDELNEYLDDYPIINSLCFVPFNMTVLLWLYKQETTLPESGTELYNYFICHTIRHHLRKKKIVLSKTFVNLDTLEEPYKKVIQELSSLSYNALETNQLIFTLEEIKASVEISGEINCFGLLQAVHFFGSTNDTRFTFAHFSVQEFFAAYYIRHLPHYKKFCTIQEKFMSNFYVNTFTMYVGMTGGKELAFKQYLSGYSKLGAGMFGMFGKYSHYMIASHSVATYPFNVCCYLRLYKCFYEVDNEAICKQIIDAFSLFFCGHLLISEDLLPSEVDCLGLFLCSRKKWKGLYLYNSIDDVGVKILHQLLTNIKISIHTIHIGNGLMRCSTDGILTQSSSLIIDIARNCETKILEVFPPVLLPEDVVTLKTQLTQLICYIDKSHIEPQVFMPVYLKGDQILQVMNLYEQHRSEDSVEAFTAALKHNNAYKCSLAKVKFNRFLLLI